MHIVTINDFSALFKERERRKRRRRRRRKRKRKLGKEMKLGKRRES